MERLDKIISSQRADGRKEVQKLIKSGAVLVNGKICKKPDAKVDPGKDEVVVDVPDKLITLIVVFFILKGLPKKLTTLYEANSEIETLD